MGGRFLRLPAPDAPLRFSDEPAPPPASSPPARGVVYCRACAVCKGCGTALIGQPYVTTPPSHSGAPPLLWCPPCRPSSQSPYTRKTKVVTRRHSDHPSSPPASISPPGTSHPSSSGPAVRTQRSYSDISAAQSSNRPFNFSTPLPRPPSSTGE